MFAKRFKKCREDAGCTQDVIAGVCIKKDGESLSRAAVAQWERADNPTRPELDNLISAAKEINASIDYMTGLQNHPIPHNLSEEAINIAIAYDRMSYEDKIHMCGFIEGKKTKSILGTDPDKQAPNRL